ncbi:MAG: hypothetical protein J6B74_09265 [Ruminococcus sp.]|nr:hypothetical protein [Ruminococcus sp.]
MEFINELNRKYNCYIDISELSRKYVNISTVVEKEKKPDNIIVPDKAYVKRLVDKLTFLMGKLGDREYKYCREKLNDILWNGDFDDSEEIMQAVHGALEKYIYESDTKVKNADWKFLEEYLKRAGYEPVPVKVGDRINDYAVYFETVIPSNNMGKSGTIKSISQSPYIIRYYDDDSVEKIKLCGKCTVYK